MSGTILDWIDRSSATTRPAPPRNLTYETPITDDVIGHLSEIDVAKHLHAIAALPKATA